MLSTFKDECHKIMMETVRATIPIDAADIKSILPANRNRGFSISTQMNTALSKGALDSETPKIIKETTKIESKIEPKEERALEPSPSMKLPPPTATEINNMSESSKTTNVESEDDDEVTDFTGATESSSSAAYDDNTNAKTSISGMLAY